jgi:ATP-dependent RNA helicase DeaD
MQQLFDKLQISGEVRHAVADMGFQDLTPIQAQSIPPILEGKDIIGQARTGTGKTVAFGIPILERLEKKGRNVEVLILCPTRELAVQVAEELKRLSKYRRDVQVVAVYGGEPIQKQFTALRRGARIVVGTPGRIMDHMNRGTLRLDTVTMVVLDEGDRMLDMGFIDDIKTILWATSEDRMTLLFSATMPEPIMELAKKYQKSPQLVNVVEGQMTVPEVEQTFIEVRHYMKLDALCHILDTHGSKSSLVFCNTKRRVDQITSDLEARGYHADSLHGDMTQSRRDRAMLRFRKNFSKILVATDVAARGLDVGGIEAVINYDIPMDEQSYVHRIGRTARMGKTGRAFTLVLTAELSKLRDIQAYAHTRIVRQTIPKLGSAGSPSGARGHRPSSTAEVHASRA